MNVIARLLTRIIDWCYLPPLRKIMPLQTFRYGFCGALNMGLDTLFYYIAYHYIFAEQNVDLGFIVLSPHMASLGVVFPITFFNGFWLNRTVAFKHSPLRHRTQLGRYLLSVGGSVVINILCMKLLVDAIGVWPTPAKMMTTLISVAYSYLMQKYFTFRGCVDI